MVAIWRQSLVPGSFRGAQFHVEMTYKSSGRRNAVHEYPKRDDPYTEDMGRRAKRFQITAYVIGSNYQAARDALIAACEAEGPAMLVHPTMGMMMSLCDTYHCHETRQEGGMARIEMMMVEAGTTPFTSSDLGTQNIAANASNNVGASAAASLDSGAKLLGHV